MKKIRKTLLFFILVVLGFVFTFSSIHTVADLLQVSGVDIIYANPGEDCMTEVTISWHSNKEDSTLIYTLASDPNYENATTIQVKGVYDETSFIYYDVCKFYKNRVDLKNLKPGTDYIYKVSCGTVVSREHKFKTAGTRNFTFGYMSDIHAVNYDNLELGMTAVKKLQTVQTLIDKSTKVSGTLDFMLTTGDEVWRGSQYSNWLEWSKNQYTTATEDYLWAGAPGNHEYYTQVTSSVWNYYPDKYASNPSAIYDDPDYFYNTYFNAVKAVPQNGPEGISSSYWFLYNNVLFICIDSMQASDYSRLNDLRKWFEDTVIKNEGKYQYIIAYQHYPWYDFQTGIDKYAYRWNDLFDKYGVDLALSGHMHGYLRTKQLYNGKVSTDETKGTYYVVSPQIGDRPKSITSYNNVDLIESWQSTTSYKDYSAMSTIEVTKEHIKYRLIDVDGRVKDEFIIKAKRDYNLQEKVKTEALNSITLSSTESSISANMDPNMVQFVRNIQLVIDNTVVKSADPSAKDVSFVKATGFTKNTVHDVVMNVSFIDGTKVTKKYKIACGEKGTLFDKVVLNANKTKVSVNFTVKEEATKYRLLLDDTLYKESTSLNFEVDRGDVKAHTKFTIEALNASNEVIAMEDAYYSLYGDYNVDGSIDYSDVEALIDAILNQRDFTENEIKLIDNNLDGKLDIGDAYRIMSYANNTKDSIKEVYYNVIIVSESGSLLQSASIKSGEDFTLSPVDISGKTFKGYSRSVKNITSDMVVIAIYE